MEINLTCTYFVSLVIFLISGVSEAFILWDLLDKLDMIKGDGQSRRDKPYTNAEDMLWDIATPGCNIGDILTKILENKDVIKETIKVH